MPPSLGPMRLSAKLSARDETDGRNTVPFWRTIYAHLKPFRRKLVVATVCALLGGTAIAMQSVVAKYIIDDAILRKGASTESRFYWALVFAASYTFVSAFRISIWGVGYKRLLSCIEGVLFSIRATFFRHVQGLCFRFHDQVSSGELFNYLMGTPIQSIKSFMKEFAMQVPCQVVSWVVAGTMLAVFDWLMLVIALSVVALAVLVNYRSKRIVRELSADFMKTESAVSKYIADMLRGCRAIKIHAVEDNISSNFEGHIGLIRDQGQALVFQKWLEGRKPEAVRYAGMAVLYVVGAYSCIYREKSVGTFVVFINCINLMMNPLMHLLQLNLLKANAEAGLDRIQRIMETQKTTLELPDQKQLDLDRTAAEAGLKSLPCIEFKNVVFSYDEKPVIDGLSCAIADGQSVALVGPSGAGKSTFVNLALRLYDPQGGEILLYGEDLRHYSLKEIRSSFGVVSQDLFFFQTNLLENIRVARPEATHDEVMEALELSYATEFIDELPDGLNTYVGEGGFNLSGGQKQRIAIARAIISKPRFFIFDEATSALDNQSEIQIQTAMKKIMRGHTTLIIAHRLTTITDVDRILVFHHGKIIQDGNYEHLSKNQGLFKDLLDRKQ